MNNPIFRYCPSCESKEIGLLPEAKGVIEYCYTCNFAVNHVLFTCGHCNPDVFAICPRRDCPNPGSPTYRLCVG